VVSNNWEEVKESAGKFESGQLLKQIWIRGVQEPEYRSRFQEQDQE